MINVMLVDDEVLALDYLQNMIDWEQNGYCIVGCATNGKRALDLYEKVKPDIIISDIRMTVMDGLELTIHLKQRNPDIIIILVSAYKDFEYAQRGIQYGVSNYLLKHELCEESLMKELIRVKEKLAEGAKRKKIYQKYFMNQLIYNHTSSEERGTLELGNRLLLMMIHKNNNYYKGLYNDSEWISEELQMLSAVLEEGIEDKLHYVAYAQITSNNLMVLYRIENTASKYLVSSVIERKIAGVCTKLSEIPECWFNIIYSNEIRQSEISSIFRKMSQQIRYAVFWDSCKAYCLDRLPSPELNDKINFNELVKELQIAIYEETNGLGGFIQYLFEMTIYPGYKLGAFRELLDLLENLLQELEEKEGISRRILAGEMFKIHDIKQYYMECFSDLYVQIHDRESKKYSKLVVELMRYIRKNYRQEISLEILGEQFQMNGVYLGQIFRNEVGITFLKYLTNYRVEEAKRLLQKGNMNVSEVAEHVGYKTSQYFSQIFVKAVGITPQEYKKWSES
ncbi:MAG: putative response regulatory protein [Herbinix sp.]|jgi:YesN/AraC family two-component response regulator|nr:putative response regulatory protein [Herbinix sp.]